MTTQDFNDDIGFGDELDQILAAPARVALQAPVQEPKLYWKGCGRCGGTGRYGSFGICFACQGTRGKYLKTAPAVRAKARVQAQDRKARTETENLEAFKVAFPAEWAWIQDRVKWEVTKGNGSDFGQSLRRKIAQYGDLTEPQLAAVRTNMAKRAAAIEAAGQRVATAPKISVERIEQAFAKAAASGLGKLTLRLATTKPGPVVDGVATEVLDHDYLFYPAKPGSQNPGGIYVKEDGQYLGKITEGRFRCVSACDDVRRDQIVAVASDPAKAAIAHGKVLGRCAICNRELSDPESVARSVGPICAERYGF
jgi:hypothetical protein